MKVECSILAAPVLSVNPIEYIYFQERIFGILEDFDNHVIFEHNKIRGNMNVGRDYIFLATLIFKIIIYISLNLSASLKLITKCYP